MFATACCTSPAAGCRCVTSAVDGRGEAMFRPEDLLLAAAGAPSQFSGEVLASLFQGDHTRLEDRHRCGASPIVARIAQRRDFAVGERLSFTLAAPAILMP